VCMPICLAKAIEGADTGRLLLQHPCGISCTHDSHAAVPRDSHAAVPCDSHAAVPCDSHAVVPWQDRTTKLATLLTYLPHPPGLSGTDDPHARCGTMGLLNSMSFPCF